MQSAPSARQHNSAGLESNAAALSRRLLSLELVADLAEALVAGGALLLSQRYLGLTHSASVWLATGVLWLAGCVTAVLRLLDSARPLTALVGARQRQASVSPEAAGQARTILGRFPVENGLIHATMWLAITAFAWAPDIARGKISTVQAVGLCLSALLYAALLAVLRMMAAGVVAERVRPTVMPNVDGMRLFMASYRHKIARRLFVVAALAQPCFIAFVWAFVATTPGREALTFAALLATGGLTLAWLALHRTVRTLSRNIEAYFDAVYRAERTRAPTRDEPSAVPAFHAAQCLPYKLGLRTGLFLGFVLLAATATVRWTFGLEGETAGRLVLGGVALGALATGISVIVTRRTLLPLLRHLGSRHRLPLADIRAPAGLAAKLRFNLIVCASCAAALAYLAAHPLSRTGSGYVLGGIAIALIGLFVGLVVSDTAEPLETLDSRSDEMARGELARPVQPAGEADEVGRLTVAFEEMRRALRDRLRSTESINIDLEREVQRRTEALERRNAELRAALEKLKRAQDDLVRSEKLASMGRLVAGIAHEVNNPVNAVINTLAPLQEVLSDLKAAPNAETAAGLCADALEMVAVVERGSARTRNIVRALHNYSRSGDTQFRSVDLERALCDSLDLLRHRLRDVNVRKTVHGTVVVSGIEDQLDQVIMNLVTNAAQAMDEREGLLDISLEGDGETVTLRIQDSGIGIPEDILPQIFDPFFTTKTVGEGSGLGLSIVHGIVERHGGSIEVDSTKDVGTTFTVTLPALSPGANGDRAQSSADNPNARPDTAPDTKPESPDTGPGSKTIQKSA